MKIHKLNLICIAAIIASMFSTVSAQQTFRVYRNDGTMELFFYTTLDSITFSPAAESELPDGYGFTQNIHTTDSVYRFLTSEIDSIAFQPLPTVYKPGVVRIEGRLRDYVTGSDSLTLFVRTSIPETLLPKPGDDVATLDCDDILPYGFLGHVEKITRTAELIQIECSQVSLLDIFDSLGLEGTSTSDTNEPVASRGAFDVWPPIHVKLPIPTFKRSFSLLKELDLPGGLSETYNMSASGELSTQLCEVNWAFFITPMPFQTPQIYWSLTSTTQHTITLEGSFGSTVKKEVKFPFEKGRNRRIPGVAAVIEFFDEAGIFIEIEGEIGLKGSFSKPFTTVLHASYDNKAQTAIAPQFRMIGGEAVTEATLEGSASVTLGLYGKFGVAPLVKEAASLETEFRAGAIFSSAIDLATNVAPIEILNTEMYDEMNRDDFYRVDLSLTGEVTQTVFGDPIQSNGLEIGDLLFRNPIFKRGAVPRFDNVKLTDEGETGKLTASATLGRKLMFSAPVGFALYDENKKFVDKWWADDEYRNAEGRTITHKFEGLKANTAYTLHPITRAFSDNMVANPSDHSKIEISLATWDAVEIRGTSAKLRGYVKGVSDNDSYICGFYYGNTPTVGPENGTFIVATDISDGVFTAPLNNLQSEVTYYYKAFVKIKDEIFLADETRIFTTPSTAQITANLELIDVIAEAQYSTHNGDYKSYMGVYKLTFENLGNRRIIIDHGLRKNDCEYIIDDKYFDNESNNKDWIKSISFGYDSSYWGGFTWFGGIAEYTNEYNSKYLRIPIKCNDNLWINDTNSWSASLPKPGGLKIHYKVDKTDEEGDVEVNYNVKYTQKPEIKNLEFAQISSISGDGAEQPRLKFDITGCHWIKDVQLDISVSFLRIGWETILIDTIKEFHGIDSSPYPYFYLSTNYYYVRNDKDTIRDYLFFIDLNGLESPNVTLRYVISCTLLDGTTISSELDIPVDLREYF